MGWGIGAAMLVTLYVIQSARDQHKYLICSSAKEKKEGKVGGGDYLPRMMK
jgi:hypothetical protein